MARKLFGTDGIRGVAGQPPLDRSTVRAVGEALGNWVASSGRERAVVIGMDTRESGPWIAAEVAAGLAAYGILVRFAGVTTTPGVAYLAKNGPFAAGVMISASHNPFEDNGIKIVGHSGYKLPDTEEEKLEEEIFARLGQPPGAPAPALRPDTTLDRAYLEHLFATFKPPQAAKLPLLSVVIDCANGGASSLGPELFKRLGLTVHPIGCSPDGRNINLNCGSLHLEGLRETVLALGADFGVAFDGDADRALFVSRSGKIIDGDAVLLIAARILKNQGKLTGPDRRPTVVATVMSNLGLERALEASDIALIRTPVGDKYVLEEMLRTGAILGGEQSGHIIFLDSATTGDGLLTALRILEAIAETGLGLDDLTRDLEVYPQRLVNVRVRHKRPLEDLPGVCDEIRLAEDAFAGSGRILVRFSGTEPLARVMVEGPDLATVEAVAGRIAAKIQTELGAE